MYVHVALTTQDNERVPSLHVTVFFYVAKPSNSD